MKQQECSMTTSYSRALDQCFNIKLPVEIAFKSDNYEDFRHMYINALSKGIYIYIISTHDPQVKCGRRYHPPWMWPETSYLILQQWTHRHHSRSLKGVVAYLEITWVTRGGVPHHSSSPRYSSRSLKCITWVTPAVVSTSFKFSAVQLQIT